MNSNNIDNYNYNYNKRQTINLDATESQKDLKVVFNHYKIYFESVKKLLNKKDSNYSLISESCKKLDKVTAENSFNKLNDNNSINELFNSNIQLINSFNDIFYSVLNFNKSSINICEKSFMFLINVSNVESNTSLYIKLFSNLLRKVEYILKDISVSFNNNSKLLNLIVDLCVLTIKKNINYFTCISDINEIYNIIISIYINNSKKNLVKLCELSIKEITNIVILHITKSVISYNKRHITEKNLNNKDSSLEKMIKNYLNYNTNKLEIVFDQKRYSYICFYCRKKICISKSIYTDNLICTMLECCIEDIKLNNYNYSSSLRNYKYYNYFTYKDYTHSSKEIKNSNVNNYNIYEFFEYISSLSIINFIKNSSIISKETNNYNDNDCYFNHKYKYNCFITIILKKLFQSFITEEAFYSQLNNNNNNNNFIKVVSKDINNTLINLIDLDGIDSNKIVILINKIASSKLIDYTKDILINVVLSNLINFSYLNNDNNNNIFNYNLLIFYYIIISFKNHVKEEIEVVLSKVIIQIFNSNFISCDNKESILDFFILLLVKSPEIIFEIFINFDLNISNKNLFTLIYDKIFMLFNICKTYNSYSNNGLFNFNNNKAIFNNLLNLKSILNRNFEVYIETLKIKSEYCIELLTQQLYNLVQIEVDKYNDYNNFYLLNKINKEYFKKVFDLSNNTKYNEINKTNADILDNNKNNNKTYLITNLNPGYINDFTIKNNLSINEIIDFNLSTKKLIFNLIDIFNNNPLDVLDYLRKYKLILNKQEFDNKNTSPFLSSKSKDLKEQSSLKENNTLNDNTIDDSYLLYESQELSNFIFYYLKFLSKEKLGILLCSNKSINRRILNNYIYKFNFNNMHLVESMRILFSTFILQGEAQIIDRIVTVFSKKYFDDNSNLFEDNDEIYYISFGIMMLQTDLHRKEVVNKMSLNKFISQFKNINKSLLSSNKKLNIKESYLVEIYKLIQDNPINMPRDNISFISKQFTNKASSVDINNYSYEFGNYFKNLNLSIKQDVLNLQKKESFYNNDIVCNISHEKIDNNSINYQFVNSISKYQINKLVKSIWSNLYLYYSIILSDGINKIKVGNIINDNLEDDIKNTITSSFYLLNILYYLELNDLANSLQSLIINSINYLYVKIFNFNENISLKNLNCSETDLNNNKKRKSLKNITNINLENSYYNNLNIIVQNYNKNTYNLKVDPNVFNKITYNIIIQNYKNLSNLTTLFYCILGKLFLFCANSFNFIHNWNDVIYFICILEEHQLIDNLFRASILDKSVDNLHANSFNNNSNNNLNLYNNISTNIFTIIKDIKTKNEINLINKIPNFKIKTHLLNYRTLKIDTINSTINKLLNKISNNYYNYYVNTIKTTSSLYNSDLVDYIFINSYKFNKFNLISIVKSIINIIKADLNSYCLNYLEYFEKELNRNNKLINKDKDKINFVYFSTSISYLLNKLKFIVNYKVLHLIYSNNSILIIEEIECINSLVIEVNSIMNYIVNTFNSSIIDRIKIINEKIIKNNKNNIEDEQLINYVNNEDAEIEYIFICDCIDILKDLSVNILNFVSKIKLNNLENNNFLIKELQEIENNCFINYKDIIHKLINNCYLILDSINNISNNVNLIITLPKIEYTINSLTFIIDYFYKKCLLKYEMFYSSTWEIIFNIIIYSFNKINSNKINYLENKEKNFEYFNNKDAVANDKILLALIINFFNEIVKLDMFDIYYLINNVINKQNLKVRECYNCYSSFIKFIISANSYTNTKKESEVIINNIFKTIINKVKDFSKTSNNSIFSNNKIELCNIVVILMLNNLNYLVFSNYTEDNFYKNSTLSLSILSVLKNNINKYLNIDNSSINLALTEIDSNMSFNSQNNNHIAAFNNVENIIRKFFVLKNIYINYYYLMVLMIFTSNSNSIFSTDNINKLNLSITKNNRSKTVTLHRIILDKLLNLKKNDKLIIDNNGITHNNIYNILINNYRNEIIELKEMIFEKSDFNEYLNLEMFFLEIINNNANYIIDFYKCLNKDIKNFEKEFKLFYEYLIMVFEFLFNLLNDYNITSKYFEMFLIYTLEVILEYFKNQDIKYNTKFYINKIELHSIGLNVVCKLYALFKNKLSIDCFYVLLDNIITTINYNLESCNLSLIKNNCSKEDIQIVCNKNICNIKILFTLVEVFNSFINLKYKNNFICLENNNSFDELLINQVQFFILAISKLTNNLIMFKLNCIEFFKFFINNTNNNLENNINDSQNNNNNCGIYTIRSEFDLNIINIIVELICNIQKSIVCIYDIIINMNSSKNYKLTKDNIYLSIDITIYSKYLNLIIEFYKEIKILNNTNKETNNIDINNNYIEDTMFKLLNTEFGNTLPVIIEYSSMILEKSRSLLIKKFIFEALLNLNSTEFYNSVNYLFSVYLSSGSISFN